MSNMPRFETVNVPSVISAPRSLPWRARPTRSDRASAVRRTSRRSASRTAGATRPPSRATATDTLTCSARARPSGVQTALKDGCSRRVSAHARTSRALRLTRGASPAPFRDLDLVERRVHPDLGGQVEVRDLLLAQPACAARSRRASGSPSRARSREPSVVGLEEADRLADGDLGARGPRDFDERPGGERLHLDIRLVGLDLGDRVTALDPVADSFNQETIFPVSMS